MIIKKLKIKNFRSYYDDNEFELSEGLTLIIGDNGDGKTTFFEALQWLFNTVGSEIGNIDMVSEMRKSKMEIGEEDEVSVYMEFEHSGPKSIEKRFTFERTVDNYSVSKIQYRGYETIGTERQLVDGKYLMDRCYDAFIQRFSMFKGESTLNVFNNPAALKELVDKYSDIRKFDDLVNMTTYFSENANKAYIKESKSDVKIAQEAKVIEQDLNRVGELIFQTKKDIKEKKSSLDLYNSRLDELEQNQETSEKYKEICDRLKTQEEKKRSFNAKIAMVDMNTSLLDKLWVLCPFPSVLQEFKEKSSSLSKERRKLDKEFNAQRNIELGKIQAIKEIQGALINGTPKLPWYLPDQETMEEMINDRICKVCGRPIEEGSDAYHFMVHKLEEYKQHCQAKLQQEEERKLIEEKELFQNNYIEELHSLSITLSGSAEASVANLANDIRDRIDLVARFRQDLKNTEERIQDIKDEKARLLIQAGNISESVLEKDFQDIKGLFEQKGKAEGRLSDLEKELKNYQDQEENLKKKLDDLNPSSSQVKAYRDIHKTLATIAEAFAEAKEENLRNFLSALEEQANDYLERLSTNDFHGIIRLRDIADGTVGIKLYSDNGTEIKNPSGSQETVMYISVLFAIAEFTQQKRGEDYPLIFDAATSSFGDSKEKDFYNVIDNDNLKKQCIIVTKDFITNGIMRTEEVEKLTCSVYRIKKADNFNASHLETIRTMVKKIK